MKKIKWAIMVIYLVVFAIVYFGLMSIAKSDNWITSPSKMYMPGNIYNTAIINSANAANINGNSNKLDKCDNVGTVQKIVVEKSKKLMTLYDVNDCIVKQYTVRTGLNKGPKQCEGDKKTPEGTYKIKDKRDSKYVRFMELDYPRAKDIKRAKELGCNPGSAVGIHYYNEEYTNDPSTLEGSLGCVTVWDKSEIREIDRLVRVGTEVIIKE